MKKSNKNLLASFLLMAFANLGVPTFANNMGLNQQVLNQVNNQYGANLNNVTGATINSNGNYANITNTQTNSTLNWNTLNTAPGQTLNFNMVSGQTALNRVISPSLSRFAGNLTSTGGRVVISNPMGMIFENGSYTNVNSLILTTKDAQFIDNQLKLNDNLSTAGIKIGGEGISNYAAVMRVADDLNIISNDIKINNADIFAGNNVNLVTADGVTYVAGNDITTNNTNTNAINKNTIDIDKSIIAIKNSEGNIYFVSKGDKADVKVSNSALNGKVKMNVDGNADLSVIGNLDIQDSTVLGNLKAKTNDGTLTLNNLTNVSANTSITVKEYLASNGYTSDITEFDWKWVGKGKQTEKPSYTPSKAGEKDNYNFGWKGHWESYQSGTHKEVTVADVQRFFGLDSTEAQKIFNNHINDTYIANNSNTNINTNTVASGLGSISVSNTNVGRDLEANGANISLTKTKANKIDTTSATGTAVSYSLNDVVAIKSSKTDSYWVPEYKQILVDGKWITATYHEQKLGDGTWGAYWTYTNDAGETVKICTWWPFKPVKSQTIASKFETNTISNEINKADTYNTSSAATVGTTNFDNVTANSINITSADNAKLNTITSTGKLTTTASKDLTVSNSSIADANFSAATNTIKNSKFTNIKAAAAEINLDGVTTDTATVNSSGIVNFIASIFNKKVEATSNDKITVNNSTFNGKTKLTADNDIEIKNNSSFKANTKITSNAGNLSVEESTFAGNKTKVSAKNDVNVSNSAMTNAIVKATNIAYTSTDVISSKLNASNKASINSSSISGSKIAAQDVNINSDSILSSTIKANTINATSKNIDKSKLKGNTTLTGKSLDSTITDSTISSLIAKDMNDLTIKNSKVNNLTTSNTNDIKINDIKSNSISIANAKNVAIDNKNQTSSISSLQANGTTIAIGNLVAGYTNLNSSSSTTIDNSNISSLKANATTIAIGNLVAGYTNLNSSSSTTIDNSNISSLKANATTIAIDNLVAGSTNLNSSSSTTIDNSNISSLQANATTIAIDNLVAGSTNLNSCSSTTIDNSNISSLKANATTIAIDNLVAGSTNLNSSSTTTIDNSNISSLIANAGGNMTINKSTLGSANITNNSDWGLKMTDVTMSNDTVTDLTINATRAKLTNISNTGKLSSTTKYATYLNNVNDIAGLTVNSTQADVQINGISLASGNITIDAGTYINANNITNGGDIKLTTHRTTKYNPKEGNIYLDNISGNKIDATANFDMLANNIQMAEKSSLKANTIALTNTSNFKVKASAADITLDNSNINNSELKATNNAKINNSTVKASTINAVNDITIQNNSSVEASALTGSKVDILSVKDLGNSTITSNIANIIADSITNSTITSDTISATVGAINKSTLTGNTTLTGNVLDSTITNSVISNLTAKDMNDLTINDSTVQALTTTNTGNIKLAGLESSAVKISGAKDVTIQNSTSPASATTPAITDLASGQTAVNDYNTAKYNDNYFESKISAQGNRYGADTRISYITGDVNISDVDNINIINTIVNGNLTETNYTGESNLITAYVGGAFTPDRTSTNETSVYGAYLGQYTPHYVAPTTDNSSNLSNATTENDKKKFGSEINTIFQRHFSPKGFAAADDEIAARMNKVRSTARSGNNNSILLTEKFIAE